MPRQRTHYSRRTYVFPDDFPQRLKRFQEESGLSWSEIARRIGTHRPTVWRWAEARVRPNLSAPEGASEAGRQPGPRPPVHRLREVIEWAGTGWRRWSG